MILQTLMLMVWGGDGNGNGNGNAPLNDRQSAQLVHSSDGSVDFCLLSDPQKQRCIDKLILSKKGDALIELYNGHQGVLVNDSQYASSRSQKETVASYMRDQMVKLGQPELFDDKIGGLLCPIETDRVSAKVEAQAQQKQKQKQNDR